jgi:hypothetical protein
MLEELAPFTDERINWDEVTKFTPDMYQLYSTAPLWEIDSPTFNGWNDYRSYWCQELQRLVTTSKAVIGRWQEAGRQMSQALEESVNSSTPVFDFNSALAAEPLPIAASQVHEKVALLASNPPIPMAFPQQENQKQYVSAINQMFGMVWEDINWDRKTAKAHYKIQFWNSACFKWNVDMFAPGIFGQPGKITLDLIATDEIFFDPACKELDCQFMDYIIQKHTMEMGDIQHQYPLSAKQVATSANQLLSDSSVSSRNDGDYIQSPVPKLARNPGRQQKIEVLECYIRDSRLKFEPLILDARKPEYKDRFKLDEDGYIIGEWVPRYPDGRLIIVTSDVVLKDIPNPFPHGEFPYVFPEGDPSEKPYVVGDAAKIMAVTRKYNDISSDVHRFYKSEVPRPMQMDSGAIFDPALAQNVPNDPTYILELTPNKRFERRIASDVPTLVYNYLQNLSGFVDMASGTSAIMRGTISDGSQMSVQTMERAQQFASSRLALAAKLYNTAARKLGRQLMWILRATIKEDIKVLVTMPDGKQEEIDWRSDRKVFDSGDPTKIRQLRATQDYMITIKASTGMPGAVQQEQARASGLFNDKAIDREAYLDAIQYPGRRNIVDRMRAQELEDIQAAGIGRQLGVNLKEAVKQEQPGRRKKE